MTRMTFPPAREMAQNWVGCLAWYRDHKNDEHLEALVEEAFFFAVFRLSPDFADDSVWIDSPVSFTQRTNFLLTLVDRGVVVRREHQGKIIYEAIPGAEEWAEDWSSRHESLRKYREPVLEMLAALRHHRSRLNAV